MTNTKLPHEHGTTQEFLHEMPRIQDFSVIADVFKLLSDPTRLRLFWLLCHCEECVLNLAAMMEMSSPALSHHLRLLKACGLITSRRDGKEVYYTASDKTRTRALHESIRTIARLSCPHNHCIAE
ncbi:MAG: winged helix-turn-helix transcriptional regulator [Oscillospiraceae bacterium]|nr:winged helix-turn-helix transcriptional regulator [Oscillospiraceae bacterium]